MSQYQENKTIPDCNSFHFYPFLQVSTVQKTIPNSITLLVSSSIAKNIILRQKKSFENRKLVQDRYIIRISINCQDLSYLFLFRLRCFQIYKYIRQFPLCFYYFQKQSMSDPNSKAERLINSAMKNIKEEDILHRGFLKPIQVALKTHKTQPKDPRFKPGALPKGLKIAVKQSLTSDKRTFHDIQFIQKNTPYQNVKENNQDNMLTLMKHPDGIKLAICVCMYSQDKKMLKNTLSGVADNIANLVAYERLDPDDIGVFVMMDGVEKVDLSIVDYFEELERSSNINLGDNIVPSLSMQQIANRAQKMTEEEIDELEIKNVNNYLFDIAELEQRNNLRFQQIRQDYDEIKDLLKEIQKLKEGKPLFDDLPAKLKPFFYEQAKEERKREYALTDEDIKEQQRDQISRQRLQKKLHEDYALNILKARPLVMKALQQGQRFCNNYISTRQDLAYVACFRKKIPFSFKTIQKIQVVDQASRSNIYNEEIQRDITHTVMNLFMCVKYKNAGKLSSHNWFFNGFCQELRPQFAILLDVGLRPYEFALSKMYRYLRANVRGANRDTGGVGGVCGYMSLKIEKLEGQEEIKDQDVDFLTGIINKFTDIQRTQQVQYHFAHLMDKGFEASFGFIHVLPGAFSAYNMKAIIDYDKDQDDQLLKNYFKSIDQKLANRKVVKSEMSIGNVLLRTCLPDFINNCFIDIDNESDQAMLYSQNVYLAEDRILCMGIHKKGYDMSYLPDSYAEVDPIKTVHGLLGQRKRWINGSYFAFEKVKKQLKAHEKDIGCEFFLNLQIFYLSMMSGLAYFAPALFLFTVHIAMDAFRSDVLIKVLNGVVGDPNHSQFFNAFVYTIDFIYVLLIMTIVFYSLHLSNRHKKFIPYIYGISTLFGLFMVCVFLVLLVDIFRGLLNNDSFLIQNQQLIQNIPGGVTTINLMRWLLIGSVGIYIVPIIVYILLFGRGHILCEIIFGGFSFLFYGPTYLNILNIYSLCRIDDISWGTKGLDSGSDKNSNLKDSWKLIKFVHVVKYVSWNIILGSVLLTLGASYTPRFFVTISMVVLIGASMGIKVVLSSIYMIGYWFSYRSGNRDPLITFKSRVDAIIEEYRENILDQVRQHLNGVKKEYLKNPVRVGSFIQASRNGEKAQNAFKKQQALQKGRSGIQGKITPKRFQQKTLPTIQQESYTKNKKDKDTKSKSIQKRAQRLLREKSQDSGDFMANSGSSNTDNPLVGMKKLPTAFVPPVSGDRLKEEVVQEFKKVQKQPIQKNRFKNQKK